MCVQRFTGEKRGLLLGIFVVICKVHKLTNDTQLGLNVSGIALSHAADKLRKHCGSIIEHWRNDGCHESFFNPRALTPIYSVPAR